LDSVTVDLIPPERAIDTWVKVEKYLSAANDYNEDRVPMHHWLARVLSCTADLYVASDMSSACLCEVIQYPNKWVYLIVLFGGDSKDFEEYKKITTDRARRIGCAQLEVRGRRGWKKKFNQWNAKLLHVHWVLDIA
jgi:hypothetical protein